MKIAYLSQHGVLEHAEVKLLNEIRHEVYSIGGAYKTSEGDGMRPPLNLRRDPRIEAMCQQDTRDDIPESLLKEFDAVIIMDGLHALNWIRNNWDKFKCPVIWRSIGQTVPWQEEQLKKYRDKGMKMVRYSPYEEKIGNYAGSDAMIRFYQDPNEFEEWRGDKEQVMTTVQNFKQRGDMVGYPQWLACTANSKAIAYGPVARDYPEDKRHEYPNWGGTLSWESLKNELRDNRCYWYAGTMPAPYTLGFMDALMAGIPVIAMGNGYLDGGRFAFHNTGEQHDIIHSHVNGYIANNAEEGRQWIAECLKDKAHAKKIGQAGRQKAIELFGKEIIKPQWETLLKSL